MSWQQFNRGLGDFADTINKFSAAGQGIATNYYNTKRALKGKPGFDPAVNNADQAALVAENQALREYLRGQGAPGTFPMGGAAEAGLLGGGSSSFILIGLALAAILLLRE